MARTIFPMVATQAKPTDLPLYKDCAWDFVADKPILRSGNPVMVTGLDAVTVWAFQALHTQRFAYEMFSFSFGCELSQVVGAPYGHALRQAEAMRFICDCLTTFPYITHVEVTNLVQVDAVLHATVTLDTIYGRSDVYV